MSLRQKTFSAVRWTTFAAVFRASLQILQIAILARLLQPSDFGLMAIVAAIVSFAAIFSDMGLGSAIIHRQHITSQQLSSLYWLNLAAGFLLMLVVSLSSPFISWFYDDSSLTPLIMLASSNFFISALGQQLRVKAEKELRFASLARIEIFGATVGFMSAIGMAYSGFGVFSLVGASIVSALLTALLSWLVLADGWRPQFRFRFGEVRDFLNFGAYMIGNNIANNINMMADIFLGGRLLGASALGLYSLPRNLCLQVHALINPIVTRVGFPVMSRVQNHPEQLRSIYLQTLRMTASVNFPLYAGIAVFAPELVVVLFGAKWTGSVDILRILALWGMFRSTMNPVGSLLLAVGKAELSFQWNMTLVLIIPGVLWWGSHFGTIGLASGLLGLQVLLIIPGWYSLVRPCCHAGLPEYLRQLIVPLCVCLGAVAIGYFSRACMVTLLPQSGADTTLSAALLRLSFGLIMAGIAYVVLSHFFNREWTHSMMQLLGKNSGY